ncbi:MAG: hypothetical protein KAH32_01520 [Chlamydiia bacterium]|nr:hypothetical protein [Chlamydiia bacterium]
MINVGKWELDDLIDVKKRREDTALRKLRIKQEELAKQERIMLKIQQEYENAKSAVSNQIDILHNEMRTGTSRQKVEDRKYYIDLLKEGVVVAKESMNKQEIEVDKASENVKKARQDVIYASKEINKLKEFRKEWAKDTKERMLEEEENEIDEVGELIFDNRRMKEVQEGK